MSDKTKIKWTDTTWNPIRGCSRVSQGCVNCYAEKVAKRFSGPGAPYEGLVDDKGRWNGTVRLIEKHLGDPLRWQKPRRVFVNSMSDLFHESLPFEVIAAICGVMAAAPKHTFQVLTKRPARALEFFEWASSGHGTASSLARLALAQTMGILGTMLSRSGKLQVIVSVEKHPEGVWLHVSASCPADGMLPDYDDMQLVKKLFVGDEREAVEVYAKRSEHVNLAEVRHLWCRLDARWDGRCA